jgi:hypothetical protein
MCHKSIFCIALQLRRVRTRKEKNQFKLNNDDEKPTSFIPFLICF